MPQSRKLFSECSSKMCFSDTVRVRESTFPVTFPHHFFASCTFHILSETAAKSVVVAAKFVVERYRKVVAPGEFSFLENVLTTLKKCLKGKKKSKKSWN